jgi:hypothetical protein
MDASRGTVDRGPDWRPRGVLASARLDSPRSRFANPASPSLLPGVEPGGRGHRPGYLAYDSRLALRLPHHAPPRSLASGGSSWPSLALSCIALPA